MPVIGGPFRGALAQLQKLRGERIIHAKGFGQVPGDIFAMGAPGAQVHFLKYAKVWSGFADGRHDAGEVFAPVDVPIEKPCARAGGSRVSVRDPVWTISSGLAGGEAVAPVKAMVSARMGGE